MPKGSKHRLGGVAGGVFTVPDAQKRIRKCAAIPGGVRLTEHCETRMEERSITFKQVQKALRKGQVAEPPKFNENRASWECKVSYHGTGTGLTVICSPLEDRLIVIAITAY